MPFGLIHTLLQPLNVSRHRPPESHPEGVTLKSAALWSIVLATALTASPHLLLAHDRHAKPQENFQGMVVEPTLPAATDVPDRILASWKQDPATSFAVTWRSKAGPDAVAEIAVATAGLLDVSR